jgi:hypothetical protein
VVTEGLGLHAVLLVRVCFCCFCNARFHSSFQRGTWKPVFGGAAGNPLIMRDADDGDDERSRVCRAFATSQTSGSPALVADFASPAAGAAMAQRSALDEAAWMLACNRYGAVPQAINLVGPIQLSHSTGRVAADRSADVYLIELRISALRDLLCLS